MSHTKESASKRSTLTQAQIANGLSAAILAPAILMEAPIVATIAALAYVGSAALTHKIGMQGCQGSAPSPKRTSAPKPSPRLAEVTELRAHIKNMTSDVERYRKQVADLQLEIVGQASSIQQRDDSIYELERKLGLRDAEITNLESELQDLRFKNEQLNDLVETLQIDIKTLEIANTDALNNLQAIQQEFSKKCLVSDSRGELLEQLTTQFDEQLQGEIELRGEVILDLERALEAAQIEIDVMNRMMRQDMFRGATLEAQQGNQIIDILRDSYQIPVATIKAVMDRNYAVIELRLLKRDSLTPDRVKSAIKDFALLRKNDTLEPINEPTIQGDIITIRIPQFEAVSAPKVGQITGSSLMDGDVFKRVLLDSTHIRITSSTRDGKTTFMDNIAAAQVAETGSRVITYEGKQSTSWQYVKPTYRGSERCVEPLVNLRQEIKNIERDFNNKKVDFAKKADGNVVVNRLYCIDEISAITTEADCLDIEAPRYVAHTKPTKKGDVEDAFTKPSRKKFIGMGIRTLAQLGGEFGCKMILVQQDNLVQNMGLNRDDLLHFSTVILNSAITQLWDKPSSYNLNSEDVDRLKAEYAKHKTKYKAVVIPQDKTIRPMVALLPKPGEWAVGAPKLSQDTTTANAGNASAPETPVGATADPLICPVCETPSTSWQDAKRWRRECKICKATAGAKSSFVISESLRHLIPDETLTAKQREDMQLVAY